MDRGELVYLDNAATTFPKPRSVIDEMRHFMLRCGGNPGRGAHFLSLEAAKKVYDCRCLLSELFDVSDPCRIAFTHNTTEALNLAIKGLLCEGDHVLISDIEHNAVWRPVFSLAERGMIEYDVFPSMAASPDRSPIRICAGIARRMKKNTRMLICTAASNICSLEMPLLEIGDFCRRHGILFVVDGAQGAGHREISVEKMRISALCIPAHKGLFGPQGCGAVIFGEGMFADTLIEGGNGLSSLEGHMGDEAPERYEAGTLPTPAIVGLAEGIRCIRELGLGAVREHERALFCMAREKLGNISGVSLHCPRAEGGVLLFSVSGLSSEEVAARLSDRGICTRGGYHCAALAHKTLGTENGGVRASFGIFNSSAHIDALACAVEDIKRG